MDLTDALIRAREHARAATKLRGGGAPPEFDAAADGRMCRLLLMRLCQLDGEHCEAWQFCYQEGCTEGPTSLDEALLRRRAGVPTNTPASDR
jgi:hypothetical protein